MRDRTYYWRRFKQREVENGPCIGIDFGGVIIDETRTMRRIDTKPNAIHSDEIAMLGVFDAIKFLVHDIGGEVWIISKVNELRQKRTLDWLNKVDFYQQTGLKKENVIFCDKREDKAQICRDLNINYFVDNSEHVSQLLQEVVPYIFFWGEKDRKTYKSLASNVIPVNNWDECIVNITTSINEMNAWEISYLK